MKTTASTLWSWSVLKRWSNQYSLEWWMRMYCVWVWLFTLFDVIAVSIQMPFRSLLNQIQWQSLVIFKSNHPVLLLFQLSDIDDNLKCWVKIDATSVKTMICYLMLAIWTTTSTIIQWLSTCILNSEEKQSKRVASIWTTVCHWVNYWSVLVGE